MQNPFHSQVDSNIWENCHFVILYHPFNYYQNPKYDADLKGPYIWMQRANGMKINRQFNVFE